MRQHKGQYSYFYVMLAKLGYRSQKEEIILAHTEGRTGHISETTADEYKSVMGMLTRELKQLPSTQTEEAKKIKTKRSKVLHYAGQCGFADKDGNINWDFLNGFMLKTSVLKKPLNKYSVDELNQLISQFQKMAKRNEKARIYD